MRSEEGLSMAHRINIERLRPVIHSQFRPTVELPMEEDVEGIEVFPPSSYELDTDRALCGGKCTGGG